MKPTKPEKIVIDIKGTQNPTQIFFELERGDEFIKLNKDGFFYKGEKVDDVHNVYERFNEWLTKANKLLK